jgi:hypothetical protein
VIRVLLDYSDATIDISSYHNPGDNLSIPQSADYAVTRDGEPFTATSYTVGTSDVTFLITNRQNITGVLLESYNGYFDGIDHPNGHRIHGSAAKWFLCWPFEIVALLQKVNCVLQGFTQTPGGVA